ncbi:MAG: PDZ domain-containing protein [Acidobacteriia bacterium]|jgi:predicted metalloprotease with PDZ domain|nr:PDZ domain-containing protein [Terriglobia bacterium]
MRCRRTSRIILWIGVLLAGALSPAQTPRTPLRYELRFAAPNTHLLEVTVHADGLHGSTAEFAMPAWTPGSYRINDYAKMVQEFSAADPQGRPLPWRKTDKQTWRIELNGTNAATVRYKVYGNTMANHWTQYNQLHAFLAGPATWMYLVGHMDRPIELSIAVPEGWRVATGLVPLGGNRYRAEDYDWFADSPIEISDWERQSFTVGETTYHVVVHDVLGQKDFTRFTADTRKIVETVVGMFGGRAPFREYWFLFHIWPDVGGGLEHLNSTQINFPSTWDADGYAGRYGSEYQLKLFVTAHEFYHAWNVKRLRPVPLGPFDYTREAHTPSLWISEGLSSYYAQLAMVRAGFYTPEQYLESIAELITEFEQMPGRRFRSIAETSWDAWFQNTPPGDTNLSNTNYSYYDAGQILGHLLDFAIRQATANRRSLDDWMRLLYERHALPRPGFTPEDAVRAASEIAGKDLSEFFRRYVEGREPLPYEEYFGYAGIEVERVPQSAQPWLGATLQRTDEDSTLVVNIEPGSPAELAGLDRGDMILGADGRKFDMDQLLQTLAEKAPGATVKLMIQRWGQQGTLTVRLGSNPYANFVLRRVENPTPLQQAIYESWLGLAGRAAAQNSLAADKRTR